MPNAAPALPNAAHALPDPWVALLAPALAHQPDRVFAQRDRLLAHTPAHARGPLQTAFARALFVLGRADAAHAALDVALEGGHVASRQLASVARPDGAAHATALLEHADPAVRADAACDLAARAWVASDPRGARLATDRALAELPHHAEARRWLRRLGSGAAAGGRDDRALLPTAGLGWLSPERHLRRVCAGAWGRPGPSGSGLAALQRIGAVSRVLATDEDYGQLRADHPLVTAERALDQALGLEREGRPAGDAARGAWHRACQVDRAARRDAAGALVALGVRDPSAAAMGLVAAELLTRLEPRQRLWRAYEARLLACIGDVEAATRRADDLLLQVGLDPVAFALCVETLRDGGAHRLAHRRARSACDEPALAATAQLLLADWDDPTPLCPMVSDRVWSRRVAA